MPNKTVPLYNPTGGIVSVDLDDVDKYIEAGFVRPSAEQLTSRYDAIPEQTRREELAQHPVAAGVLSAAVPLTGGLSSLVERGVAKAKGYDPSVFSELREENPKGSFTGTLIGAIASNILTGGATAGNGALPFSAASRAASKAATSLVGSGLGLFGGAKQAVLANLPSAIGAQVERYSQDKPIDIEQFWWDNGAALVGGALTGGLAKTFNKSAKAALLPGTETGLTPADNFALRQLNATSSIRKDLLNEHPDTLKSFVDVLKNKQLRTGEKILDSSNIEEIVSRINKYSKEVGEELGDARSLARYGLEKKGIKDFDLYPLVDDVNAVLEPYKTSNLQADRDIAKALQREINPFFEKVENNGGRLPLKEVERFQDDLYRRINDINEQVAKPGGGLSNWEFKVNKLRGSVRDYLSDIYEKSLREQGLGDLADRYKTLIKDYKVSRDLYDTANSALQKAEGGQLLAFQGSQSFTRPAATLGGAAGALAGGPPGLIAGAGAGWLGGLLAYNQVVKKGPAYAAKLLWKAEDTLGPGLKTREAISHAIDSLTGKLITRPSKAILPLSYKALRELDPFKNDESLNQVADRVDEKLSPLLSENPSAGGQAMMLSRKALSYLDSQRPSPPIDETSPQPLLNKDKVSQEDKNRYLRKVRAVMQPQSVLIDLSRGSVDPDALDAFSNVYPHSYEKIKEIIANNIGKIDKELTYRQRQTLGQFYRVPMIPSQRPATLRRIQATYTQDNAQNAQQTQNATRAPNNNVPSQVQSQSQKIQSSFQQ